jgi:hypothetical protein
MSSQLTVKVVINSEELALRIAFGQSDYCVDFQTGAIVPSSGCPEQDTGDGRPALHQGKRFIRIPAFDELQQEFKARYDEWEQGDYEDSTELLPGDASAGEMRGNLAPRLEAARQDPGYREWAQALHGDMAAEAAAMRWIAILRPSCLVGWYEEGIGVTQVYDPASGEWQP